MSTVPAPDFSGFRRAQATLLTVYGRDVRFYGPADIIYDPAIPPSAFDDGGIPLDPLAGASAVASADVAIAGLTIVGSAVCNVVFNPLQSSIMRRDQTYETQLAIRSGLNKDLLVAGEDYAQVEGAAYYQLGVFARDEEGRVIYPEQWTPEDGELWKIVNLKRDTFGGYSRLVIYGQGTL